MPNYNPRQFAMMLTELTAFEKKEITLRNVTAKLEGLLNALHDIDESWKRAFLHQWGVLEDVHAHMLDQGLKEIPPDNLNLVQKAVEEMKALIGRN